jgi:hypothetical protein
MAIFIAIQLYLLLVGFFLAKKDAESYLMKDNISTPTILSIIKRWHTDGVILAILINIPLLYDFHSIWWQLVVVNVFLRLAEFDLVFNKYANLSLTFLGSTATLDKIFSKIFGQNGAVIKSFVFFIALIAFNFAKIIFKF